MLQEQFTLLMPIVTILVLLAVFTLYVYYSTERMYRIKLLMGPALLLACTGAFPYLGATLGYGWPAALPESFEYMAHKPIVVGREKRWIDVMVVSRKPFKLDPRLHRVPWSQTIESALDQAQAMKEGKEGGTIVLDSARPGASSGDAYPRYVPRRVLPQQENPKRRLLPREAPDEEPRVAPGDPQRSERQYV